jgi:hypothetical protein
MLSQGNESVVEHINLTLGRISDLLAGPYVAYRTDQIDSELHAVGSVPETMQTNALRTSTFTFLGDHCDKTFKIQTSDPVLGFGLMRA